MAGDLSGRTIVITGASSGVGLAAARELARRGAQVVPIGRTPERVLAVARELGVPPLIADFARFDDVRRLAEALLRDLPRIDVLAHNAGLLPRSRVTTIDGHELAWQANYLAPFLLQQLLHVRLAESRTRVIVTGSLGHWAGSIRLADPGNSRGAFSARAAYCNSKLALLLFAREIARRFPETGVTAAAFHPGFVLTNMSDPIGPAWTAAVAGRLLRVTAPEVGAVGLVHLASTPEVSTIDRAYYHPSGRPTASSSRSSRDAALGRALWAWSEAAVA